MTHRRLSGLALLLAVLSGACVNPPPQPDAGAGSTRATGSESRTSATRPSAVATSSTTAKTPSQQPASPLSPSEAPTSQPGPSSVGRPTTTCPDAARGWLRQAPGGGKTVALTFDDGPGSNEAEVLSILARYRVRATFFLTGAHAAARPDDVRAIAAAGHFIAGHSYDHDYPAEVSGGWTTAYLRDQILRTNSVLTPLTGQPVCAFRPPGGFTTAVQAATGPLRQAVWMWSVDSQDWSQPSRLTTAATQAIVKASTTTGGQQHPVVLLHSTKASHEPESEVSAFRGNTLAALPAIIEWYRDHGYRFVGLDGRS